MAAERVKFVRDASGQDCVSCRSSALLLAFRATPHARSAARTALPIVSARKTLNRRYEQAL
jgi:hypothetical protein